MSKPIEKDCRAIIIGGKPPNKGTVVTVGSFLGKVVGYVDHDRWEVDKPLRTFGIITGKTKLETFHISETRLKRIDDGEELSTWQSIEQLTNWNPEKVGITNE